MTTRAYGPDSSRLRYLGQLVDDDDDDGPDYHKILRKEQEKFLERRRREDERREVLPFGWELYGDKYFNRTRNYIQDHLPTQRFDALPEGWKEKMLKDGRIVYENIERKYTQDHLPTEEANALPDDWIELLSENKDRLGMPYYVNTITRESRWEKPYRDQGRGSHGSSRDRRDRDRSHGSHGSSSHDSHGSRDRDRSHDSHGSSSHGSHGSSRDRGSSSSHDRRDDRRSRHGGKGRQTRRRLKIQTRRQRK
jgi:hypothetical protein